MIPFKPPLKAELNELLDDEHRFSIQMFMERQVRVPFGIKYPSTVSLRTAACHATAHCSSGKAETWAWSSTWHRI